MYPLKDNWEIKNVGIFGDTRKVVLHAGNYFTTFTAPRFTSNSYTITANVNIPSKGAQGVLVASGGVTTGLSFYVKDNKLVFAYNADGKLTEIVSNKAVPTGKVELKADVVYSGDAKEKNKAVTIYINGENVGSKDLGKISAPRSSIEGLDVGTDRGSAPTPSYKAPFTFNGQLEQVVIEWK